MHALPVKNMQRVSYLQGIRFKTYLGSFQNELPSHPANDKAGFDTRQGQLTRTKYFGTFTNEPSYFMPASNTFESLVLPASKE